MPVQILSFYKDLLYNFSANELVADTDSEGKLNEKEKIPDDISESELVEMLTDCMAIKILKSKGSSITPQPNKKRDQKAGAKDRAQPKRSVVSHEDDSLSDTSSNYLVKTNPYFYKLAKRTARADRYRK